MREWIGILLFILLCGCETIVDLDIPGGYQPKLVVTAHFSPDSLWKLHVGKSVPLTDISKPSELMVPDASIIIFGEDGFRDTLQHIDRGVYQTIHNHHPISDETYKVHVNVDGFPLVEASSRAPFLESELLEMENISRIDSSAAEHYRLRLRLADQPGKNYYRLNLYQVMPFCKDDTGGLRIEDDPGYSVGYDWLSFQGNSPSFYAYIEAVDDPTIPDLEEDYETAFFSDQLFEAATKEFEITFEPIIFESISPHFMLVLTALSEELFAYERSLELHDIFLHTPNIFQSSNRLAVYANVLNGLGIFAGYTSHRYRFDTEGNEWQEDVLGIGTGELQPCREQL